MNNSAPAALLFLLLASPLCICAGQAIMTRILGRLQLSIAPQLLVLGTVVVGNLPMLWLAWKLVFRELSPGAPMVCGLTLVVVTYNALGFCYFCLFNLSETSLHVHILMALLVSGPIRVKDLESRYNVSEMIDTRVERMIALGQLRFQNELYVAGSRGLLLVGRVIHVWRKLLGLPLSPG